LKNHTMAPTTRESTKELNSRTENLVTALKQDPSKVLAYPPDTFVVRRKAFRDWGLSEKDLKLLDESAYLSKKRGKEGVYYSKGDIRALLQHCKDTNLVEDDMIAEVVIKRSLPKKLVNLERLRLRSVRGKKPRSRGRETYFYKKKDVEECLNVKVIQDEQDGVDYIRSERVPTILQLELPSPKYALMLPAPGQMVMKAELCYFQPEVGELLRSPLMRQVDLQPKSLNLRSSEALVNISEVVEVAGDNSTDSVVADNEEEVDEEQSDGAYDELMSDD